METNYWGIFYMKYLKHILQKEEIRYFIKYLILFSMLFLALAAMALNKIISIESNPFFYQGF